MTTSSNEASPQTPDFMDEARMIAAQCWCDKETEHLIMQPELAEAFAKRLDTWMQESARNQRNAEYYRSLLLQCVNHLGPYKSHVFVQDDGGIVPDPLVAKIPELVEKLSEKLNLLIDAICKQTN